MKTSSKKQSPYGRKKYKTAEEYISSFPEEIRLKLESLRKTILKAAPDAEEVISYNMPAYRLNGILVYFAAYKNHIGFYPTSSPIKHFKNELTDYKTSKGAIQFPLDKPLPSGLVTRIIKFRIKEIKLKLKLNKK